MSLRTISSSFSSMFAFVALSHFVLCGIFLITAPIETIVAYLPDDAFYYLHLARTYAEQGIWSFDGGVSRATGFHLLWGYLLAAIYRLGPFPEEVFLRVAMGVSFGIATLGAGAALRQMYRKGSEEMLLVIGALLFSPNLLFNAFSVTEWSITIAVTIALFATVRHLEHPPGPGRTALGFFLGVFGSFARSDFGLVPAFLFAEAFFHARRLDDRRLAQPAFVAFVGAILGVFIVLYHAFTISGSWVQASALVKNHWASFVPFAECLYNALMLAPNLFGFDFTRRHLLLDLAVTSAICAVVIAGTILARRASFLSFSQPNQRGERTLSFLLLAYLFFYTGNAALQPWYTVHLVVPVALLLAAPIGALRRRVPVLTGLALFFLVIHNLLLIHPLDGSSGKWPHQRAMLAAGRYIKEHQPTDGRVGAWNAGIIGYFAKGNIVNLDGLVNDEVVPFIRAGNLADYLESEKIRYLVDFEIMLNDPTKRKRGGYDNAPFLRDLTPIRRFDDGEYSSRWRFLTLYRVGP